jgi:hypothetical protein
MVIYFLMYQQTMEASDYEHPDGMEPPECPSDKPGHDVIWMKQLGQDGEWWCDGCRGTLPDLKIVWTLRKAEYGGKTSPIHHNQTITNSELYRIFERMDGNTYLIDDLQKALEGKIRVNTDNPKSSVISSSYLKRLNRISGDTWHQRREVGENGEKLVKFYTDPEYSDEKDRRGI